MMPKNDTIAPAGASGNALAGLTDFDLDRKIAAQNQMIESAIAEVEKCKKSAVLSAWRLGQFLIEKKGRLAHGEWLPWLDSCGISASSASDYTRIASQIASAGSLGPSIRATLELLPALATAKPKSVPEEVVEPATATPKTVAVRIGEPATATPKTVAVKIVESEPVWPTSLDSAAMIEGLEIELYSEREKNETLEERVSIILEAADPEIRETVDRLANQAELIRTLKAQVAEWQSKASEARKENAALKRRIRELEKEAV